MTRRRWLGAACAAALALLGAGCGGDTADGGEVDLTFRRAQPSINTLDPAHGSDTTRGV